eukprot:1764105-Prymnesium_polylepis.1
MANSQIERVCSTSGRGEVSKAERDERLKVLVSAKALRREPSERRKTSVTKGSNTRPGLSQGMQDLNDAVSSAPKAAPNAAATSSN